MIDMIKKWSREMMREVGFPLSILFILMIIPQTILLAQAPEIEYTSPAQNKLNVPVDIDIWVAFNVDMDPTSINDTTFIVNSRSTGLHTGSFSYDGETVTFDPCIDFEVGEVVTVVLTTSIRSSTGESLESSYAWSFTIQVIQVTDGSCTFDPPLNYPVGDGIPRSVFAADLSGDGNLDLSTANNIYFGNVALLLNNGCEDILFDYEQYPVGKHPRSVFAADLDGDGDLDLATANHWPDEDDVSVLLNSGDGTSFDREDYPGGGSPMPKPSSIFAADLDGDGHLDLVTANTGHHSFPDSTVSVLLNNGDGTFASAQDFKVGNSPLSVFAADLDGDGDLDLATASYQIDSVSVLLNNGDGTFAPHQKYTVNAGSYSVFAADLDGDGDLDLATANYYIDKVSVLFNDGNGTFDTLQNYTINAGPNSVFAADLDGDGDLDLATANSNSGNVAVLVNNGYGTFASPEYYTIGEDCWPYSIFAADLDGDGDIDLTTANYPCDSVSVLLNHGSPFFPPGDFKLGRVKMKLWKESHYLDEWPALDSEVELHDTSKTHAAGYTDHFGNVTFQIPIECRDRTLQFDAYFKVTVRVYESKDGPRLARNSWDWSSSWKKTKREVFDACILHLDPGETKTYWVEVTTWVFVGIPFVKWHEWWDEDSGYVEVISRAHSDYQQQIEICQPHPGDTCTIGTPFLVRVHVGYKDADGNDYDCTETPVNIGVVPQDGWGNQWYYAETDGFGDVEHTFNIDEELDDGPVKITAGDRAKDDGFIEYGHDEVVIQAVSSDGVNTFGLFAIPDSSVAQGDSVDFTVAVVSINYAGDVELSVSDLPEGASGWFAPPLVYILLDTTVVSKLTIATTNSTPSGLHQFTISATDGSETRNFTCPLMVDRPLYDECLVDFYHGRQRASNFGAVGNDSTDNFVWDGTSYLADGSFIVATTDADHMALDVYNCEHRGWIPAEHMDFYYDYVYNANIAYGNFFTPESVISGEYDSVFIVGIMDSCVDFSIKIKIYYNPTETPIEGMYMSLFEDWNVGDANNNWGYMDPDHNLMWMYDPIEPNLVFGMMKAPFYDDLMYNLVFVRNPQYV